MAEVCYHGARKDLAMSDSVFRDPEAVKQALKLPAVINYSFIGDPSPAYHARLEQAILEIVADDHIQSRRTHPSRTGKFVAYKYDIFHECYEDVEAVYRAVSTIPGTRCVL